MKILSVVGARPQFVKLASLAKLLSDNFEHMVLHTGQHYSPDLSDIFFKELQIKKPDFNLGIGSSTHGKQTARMLEGIETVLLDIKPEILVVFGDTNSTLASSLAASKLHIPIVHIEAGLRSYNRKMPEEINRIVTDHLSDTLFVPSSSAAKNLDVEGLGKKVHIVGDVMFDTLSLLVKNSFSANYLQDNFGVTSNKFYLATIHRPENTNNIEKLRSIIDSFSSLDYPVVFPMHPRTEKFVNNFNLEGLINSPNIRLIKPQGPLNFVSLMVHSNMILTDSGGIQKEAYFISKPCITIREETEWVETVEDGWNKISSHDKDKILSSVLDFKLPNKNNMLLGREGASKKIVEVIIKKYTNE